MTRTLFLCLSSLLLNGLLYPACSQYNTDIGKVSISSPNAAALGKYGDIPVSTHTGIPDIEIPIYSIQTGPLSLPISLSYHASGLKVQEQASWVGAGWALNAGGMITRTVVGAPDDKGLNAAYTAKAHYTDYGYNSYLFSPGPANCSSPPAACAIGRSGMPTDSFAAQDSYFQTGTFDGEPDLFFYNFNGYSGKFYFNDDRTPILVPEQDIKIVPLYTGSDWRGLTGFILTTPDGVRYYFGQNPLSDGNADAIEITYNLSTQNTYNGQGASSAWYLNRIVSADGLFGISLFYQPESYSCYSFSMYPIPGIKNANFFAYNHEYDLDKNFINGVRLSKIVFANGEVDFNPGSLRQDLSLGTGPLPSYSYTGLADQANNDGANGARALGSIAIRSNGFCRQFSLATSYFLDNSSITADLLTTSYPSFNITCDKYRLRLDSILERSCDSSLHIPPYKFTYYSGTVPRKLSFGIDHWGFYNGVTSNNTLIPTYTIGPPPGTAGDVTTVSGADRDTHWPGSLGGALQQITYPTGGFSSFVYESNDVYTARPTINKTNIQSFSAGYSGPSTLTTTGTFTTDATSNTYELDISSNQPTNQSGGNLEFAGGPSFQVNAGQSKTYQFTLSPSTTYSYTFYDNNNGGQISGYGVSATLYELVPTTVYGNSPVGGIRIKTVTSNDGITANNIVTSYNYTYANTTGAQSSGILFSQPIYVQGIRNDVWGLVNGSSCSSSGCLTCFGSNVSYYQSPSSIRPMATSQGNHIGYGEVFVSQAGNGYTDNRYYSSNGTIPHVYDPPLVDVCVRNLSTFCDPGLPNSPAPPEPFDPMRGELLFQGHYNQSGQLIKSSTSIPAWQSDSIVTPGIIGKFFLTGYTTPEHNDNGPSDDGTANDPLNSVASGDQVPVGVNTFTEYTLQSARKIRDSVITSTYDPATGNYLTDISTTYYGSSHHHQPTQTLSYSSKGALIVKNLKNAFDFPTTNFTVPDQLGTYNANINTDNTYVSNGLASVTLSPTDPNYYWQRFNIFQNYRYRKAIDRQTYIAYRRQNFTDAGNVYQLKHDTAKALANTELKPILELQDEYKNPVIEQSSWKNGNLLQGEFTRYDYAVTPSNFVYPNKTQLINLSAPSASYSGSLISENTLVKDSRYADEVTYNFVTGNPLEVTAHNGINTSYVWDYINTEPIATVLNATPDQIAYTSFEADGAGNWTIGSAARDTTAGITGTKSYVLNSDISKSGLISATTYLLSYWTTNHAPFTISGTLSGYPVKGKTITINHSDWTLYTHRVTGQTTVTISGAGHIDELRLYPLGAQMTTYTYQPLVGMTSQTDIGNRITYYEYDGLQRLKRVRDQDYNILKTLDYQYQASTGCGGNCYNVPMQTLAGTTTLGYPVGVFDVHGALLGNATGPASYVTLWNADTADARIGTLSTGTDSLHFSLTLNTGITLPAAVTGCRYYQYDLPWNQLDGVRNSNGVYVNFGDGEGMRLAQGINVAPVLSPHTSAITNNSTYVYYVHTYPDTSLKTVTLYHNDFTEFCWLDNKNNPATSLTKLRNFRGNLPQQTQLYGFSSYQQAGALTVDSISNWNSISSVTTFRANVGDGDMNPCKNLSFVQDFMKNSRNLQIINTCGSGYHFAGYQDSTFKISRLKSDWNTYFTNLQTLSICDDHWNREDLTALTKLSYVLIVAGTQDHDSNYVNPPVPIPLPTSVIDNIINQVAAGAGQSVYNGTLTIITGGSNRTTASNTALAQLQAKGWTISLYW